MTRLPPTGPAALVACLALGASAHGQDPAPLRLAGLAPGGARTSVTEGWGTLQFTLANPGPAARDARVLVFYPEAPDVQYGRDVWVPGGAQLAAWLPVGPAPARSSVFRREVRYQLYDRTGGEPRLQPPPGDDRLASRAVPYRRREPTTAVLLDDPGAPADDALLLARTFRQARGLSEAVTVVRDRFLPPTPEAFDGVDHLILAGNRLAADPVGLRAVRHWVQQGGALWVLLDRVDPATVAPLLGEEPGFEVVGRTSLTTVRLGPTDARAFDQPVDLVRVLLPASTPALFEANGWPAAFARPVGRGRVVFTTLGGRAWHSPRGPRDVRSPFEQYPDLPLARPELERLAVELYPEPEPGGFKPDDLGPLLTAEIGYTVPGRGTAALVLGGFALALLGVGLWVRNSRRPGVVGWLGPAAAVIAAGLFAVLGAASRRAVPPTAGAAAVVAADPGSGEGAAAGLYAVYYPESGAARLAADRGGTVELDPAGLDGQTRRRVQTDLGAWHWENIALPAGVRVGPFRATVETGPVSAAARFGPEGVAGRLATGTFRDPADAVILTPARELIAARLSEGGTFAAGPADVLPAGQFLDESAVLTDRQQRRRDVYRRLLTRPRPNFLDGRDLLLAWVDPPDLPFAPEPGRREVGAALLVVPLAFERPAAGTRVTVPGAFVPYAAVYEGKPIPPTLEGTHAVGMRLRFQLPRSVRPLAVERATLVARVRAPSRRFSVTGTAGGRPEPLAEVFNPIDPVRVEIADARLLRPDPDGGLLLGVAVGDRTDPGGGRAGNPREVDLDAKWRIDSLSLEVVGRVDAP